jgi:hypothetical protein
MTKDVIMRKIPPKKAGEIGKSHYHILNKRGNNALREGAPA